MGTEYANSSLDESATLLTLSSSVHDQSLSSSSSTALDSRAADRLLEQFRDYLVKTVSSLLPERTGLGSAGDNGASSLQQSLNDRSNLDSIQKFVCDPQIFTLSIQRYSIKDDESDQATENDDDKDDTITYLIRSEVTFTNSKVPTVVFIKRNAQFDPDKEISSQVRLVHLNDGSPYETLHSIVSKTISPFFKSYVKETGRADRDGGDKMAPSVEKKIVELEMGLLYLQQNIDIPEITLAIHPTVANVMKRCADDNRKALACDFADKIDDSTFLNQLQNGVNRWVKEIQKVTTLNRDPHTGTALQEITFWLNLERALYRIQEKLESPEVLLTLDLLKKGKRFHATVSFDTDIGLKQALSTVTDYNNLMRDFPINDLISASELDKIKKAIQQIFSHMRKLRNTKYPVQRCLRFLEAISRDLCAQMLKVLGVRRLMHNNFDEFEKIMTVCFEVFNTWDDQYDKVHTMLRDIAKRYRDENIKTVWRLNLQHKLLQTRMEEMRKFRRQHEQLRSVITRVLSPILGVSSGGGSGNEPGNEYASSSVAATTTNSTANANDANSSGLKTGDFNITDEVSSAYENVKEFDCLDLSNDGGDLWKSGLERYQKKIEIVEQNINSYLQDQLNNAKNANEMFRIFSRFNALFVRPNIRGSIRKYQTDLIQRVKDDIEMLHEKFKYQYTQSKNYEMSEIRDVPPVSGSIIWARQINNQLTNYLSRVEAVLGKDWESHIEGQKLKEDGDSFRAKLSTQQIFDDWIANMQSKNLSVVGSIFTIESVRSRNGLSNHLKLKVDFHPEIITMAKEVRNLKNLGYRIPLPIVNKALITNQLYPFAISLIETVRTYGITLEKIEDKASIVPLVSGMRKEVLNLIQDGFSLIWESYKLSHYAASLSEAVISFQERVEELLIVAEQLDIDVRSLETCPYSASAFKEILKKIQGLVDEMSLKKYSNLKLWVRKLDEEIERVLAKRLREGIEAWTDALIGSTTAATKANGVAASVDGADEDNPDEQTKSSRSRSYTPIIQPLLHEVRILNQTMSLYPNIEEARCQILNKLFAWQAIVTSQYRLQSNRYQVKLDLDQLQLPNYQHILIKQQRSTGFCVCLSQSKSYHDTAGTEGTTSPNDGMSAINRAYEVIEKLITDVHSYVNEWLCYQALWDLQPDHLYSQLGNDIELWMKCLNDIKKSRTTFDTSDSRREFGPIIIDYMKVQSKVTMKYDSWHKETVSKFATFLAQKMTEFYAELKKSRSELETHSIEIVQSTGEAVGFITFVQTLKKKLPQWDREMSQYKEGQLILTKQRFQFPTAWLDVENIDGEWGAFNEILKRRDVAIQSQVEMLRTKIVSEDKAVTSRTIDLLNDWHQTKPIDGRLRPEDAIGQLVAFETKLSKLKDERDSLRKAKEALELSDLAPDTNNNQEKMVVALEELQDLKGVWTELSKIWLQIDEVRDRSWLSIQARKLRQTLDSMLGQLKQLPARLRQYASYEHVKCLLQNYTKVNLLIGELKSDALKERHWKQLIRRLNVNWILSDLTLGQVWDVNLQKNEVIVREIITIAQGEMALEEFLKQVREFWQNYQLDLIAYQTKCRLIRSWDELFAKVNEHINSVAAMKLSPYYRAFEEEAVTWEEKLNRIKGLFDTWIDVQRRWVYLEGIFSGSADIKTLLPMETSRFNGISQEFLNLMKKVAKSPLVIDVLNINNVQWSLDRLADNLFNIQKALGEYLERERTSFPRFYFVGDEDLLEIIGNSKNVARLQKHFKKMFAGISSILLSDDNAVITGIASREGEEVHFASPINIEQHPKINEWLKMVEMQMRLTLAANLANAVDHLKQLRQARIDSDAYLAWIDRYQAQIVILSTQISWSEEVETALRKSAENAASADDSAKRLLEIVLEQIELLLQILADSVLQKQPPLRRKKIEHLINEFVHKRTVTRRLISKGINSAKSFEWLSEMRFYFDPKQTEVLKKLTIHMANAKFYYGFEYLGVHDRLVQTPLTDRCYLTMTQALEARLGGSPFGPAGTGKTESVKALGHQLGRFVLVFNCDETFDFQAMGRIFVGLCQVGAWGCFDEFNRLDEKMLSAVSQQVQTIQEALRASSQNVATASSGTGPDDNNYDSMASNATLDDRHSSPIVVELVKKQVRVSPDMAIFITMNPGYAGRSNLPDNLKQLFRSLAMTTPDRQLIAEVMLFSQGFRSAEKLANKIVPFFKLCDEQLSNQSHYDFGLRALKSVLISAGNVKRDRIVRIKESRSVDEKANGTTGSSPAEHLQEQEILIQSVCETLVPKLIAEDIPLLFSLLNDVFPTIGYKRAEMDDLKEQIRKVCHEEFLVFGESTDQPGALWMEKVLQLYQISNLNHGLMMVGPSGSGKSTAWRVLLKALERCDGIEGVAHVIDPKAISKESLYGVLDPNTREWTDGLFTHILRKIIDNVRGEITKRQWIIFDGDVDPEWVENLNSVLDDNKLLTLPNGERLSLPANVRIMFEVQDLKYATLATVSRCGMVWFSEDVLSIEMIFENYMARLKNIPLDEGDDDSLSGLPSMLNIGLALATAPLKKSASGHETLAIQQDVAGILQEYFVADGLIERSLEWASRIEHIMDFTRFRALSSLFSMLNQSVRNVLQYNQLHPDFPLASDILEKYIQKNLVYALLWSFAGDAKLKARSDFGEFLRTATSTPLPPQQQPILDYEVSVVNGEWVAWSNRVPQTEVETHKVASPDVVVPTLDTVRHESLLYTWLAEHKPLVLCGPPGSGKTMTLFSALRALPEMEVVGLNFSSATTPELLLKTFDHYCEYRKTPNGTVVLSPIQLGKWLVLFCDEINLPEMDSYGTQRVITFLRQLVEQHGFYRTSDHAWVRLERIQFVGACNPPTDPGRKPLSHRFLRHVPVIYVDYPGETSLKQIYGTFIRAMLRLVPNLKGYAEPLTNSMVEFYLRSQEKFTQDMQPHYVYSPREMTRWVRGICEALRPMDSLQVEDLVRLWAHEALRLFQDRLIENSERSWTDDNIDAIAAKYFPMLNISKILQRPILFSNWLSKNYVSVNREDLRQYVKARLKVFYEEELDVPLVLFDEVLEHVLRIDRIFRQPQGHLLLIGVSGAGKTTLSRFVAWINGLSIFQIKVHNKYTSDDFDEDLRGVLRRSGCKDEKIVFILDESNVLDSGFLERMNTLLANGEVPGLFEGDEYTTLITQCKEGAQRDGLMLDSHDELYKWFTGQVMKNLHVVFTMNPSADGLKSRAATSPALFNRCVLNWFGDWSNEALFQVAKEFTNRIDMDRPNWEHTDYFPAACKSLPDQMTYRDAVINACVYVHGTLHVANNRLLKKATHTMAITPRHFLDFIKHFVRLYLEKRNESEEQQLHLNVGLAKIAETVEQVEEMQKSLAVKSQELQTKNTAANIKLQQMVKDQNEAEKKKVESELIQEQLKVQTVAIEAKRKEVLCDLARVEPAVIEAQNGVKSIKKQQLVEIRSMANPPAIVKVALESICLLLGETATDWKSIRAVIMRENFISTIVSNFNTEDISDEVRDKMRSKYLQNADYNFEKINHASNACGPLVKWAIAQVEYADMLKRVEPLRLELQSLEEQAETNQKHGDDIKQLIEHLEQSIASYREEYAQLIAQAEAIKSDLKSVQAKVDRSIALLKSLTIERDRWESTSETFKYQMSTIVGDCLLSAAFLAYGGYYDQYYRQNLFVTWANHLTQAQIQFRADIARTEYLSNPDERLRWQANALPTDDLCTENAIMIKRFNRYPLIIDPSGQATEFILNEYRDQKIKKTSFLDDSFRKNLESALRFGNPLLVQDVENYDPILNPVLNRELRRQGGRVLITLGDQDIDLSPSFIIFLSTRDPSVQFPPDICSRVTFINFTVTRNSLQSQCLNKVLKTERPDIDEKRSDLLKLQGEFKLRLRQLEKSLLQALNDAKGKILNDDSVITSLESLKKEAAEIGQKVEETDKVIGEIETVSQQYLPLSQACSSLYFMMDSLHQIHFLYQYSLKMFLDIFDSILRHENPQLCTLTDPHLRLSVITKQLFSVCYERLARSMLHNDRLALAMVIARIFLKGGFGTGQGSTTVTALEEEFGFMLRGNETTKSMTMDSGAGDAFSQSSFLTNDQRQAADKLQTKLSAFSKLAPKITEMPEFNAWLQQVTPEKCIPQLWNSEKQQSVSVSAMYELLLIQVFRPDRLVAAAQNFVSVVMGDREFMERAEDELNLADCVQREIGSNVPVLLCSVSGYDASYRVVDLATQLNRRLTSIALGSAEGFNEAEQAINMACKNGRWVLLKNVHLAPQWLVQLEKKLHSLQANSNFRLFLTMEINPKLPVNLLRAGRIFVFEPPPGIRANLLRTFTTVPAERIMSAPHERCRLYFLLAWFHAIVQERLRYCPLGWSKRYEFNESDLRVACDTLDTWIDQTAMGRNNLPPEKVPWEAIRTLLSQSIYGGKIDNDFDQRLLNSFLNRLFTAQSFDANFVLVANVDSAAADGRRHITMPEGMRRDYFLQWIEALGDRQTPQWLGLPENAERVLLTDRGSQLIAQLLKMEQFEDVDDEADGDDEQLAYGTVVTSRDLSTSAAPVLDMNETILDGFGPRPSWMKTLYSSAIKWLKLLPLELQTLKRTVENIKDPLYRCFERETNYAAKLLKTVIDDLKDVVLICQGEKKQTNYHRAIVNELVRGILPANWRRYTVPRGCTVIQWITDFSDRIRQFGEISDVVAKSGAKHLQSYAVWLGGLSNPEAYITATRQCVAQANNWSLEELQLHVSVSETGATAESGFRIVGMKLQGAQIRNNRLLLSQAILTDLPAIVLRWLQNANTSVAATPVTLVAAPMTSSVSDPSKLNLPVYLNATRSELLFTIDMHAASGNESYQFYERGVAFLASTALN